MCLTCFTITVFERNESTVQYTHCMKGWFIRGGKNGNSQGENLCKINSPAGMQKRNLQEAARAPSSSAVRVPQVR